MEKLPEEKNIDMYFNPDVAEKFAALEQNEKNFRVANIADRVIMSEIGALKNPLYAAELGGGAHPDRYHKFFGRLLTEPKGHIDWVDVSPYMLELADKYGFDVYLGDWKNLISDEKREGETMNQDMLVLRKTN